jgi:hypothetical protein
VRLLSREETERFNAALRQEQERRDRTPALRRWRVQPVGDSLFRVEREYMRFRLVTYIPRQSSNLAQMARIVHRLDEEHYLSNLPVPLLPLLPR